MKELQQCCVMQTRVNTDAKKKIKFGPLIRQFVKKLDIKAIAKKVVL